MSYSITNFRNMIWSPILFTPIISFFHSLYIIISTSFLNLTLSVYQSLNYELSISFAFLPVHLVFCRHVKLIFLLTIVSTTYINFPVSVHIFHFLKWILLSWTDFFTTLIQENVGTLTYFLLHPNDNATSLTVLTLSLSHATRYLQTTT